MEEYYKWLIKNLQEENARQAEIIKQLTEEKLQRTKITS